MRKKKTSPDGAKFQVVRIIGTGAHSTLWQVRDPRSGQECVLKRVVKNSSDDERYFLQTLNEYEIARQIDHPNVRKVFELRKVRKWFSVRELQLRMEYCPGRNVQEKRPSGVVAVCSIFAQAANALRSIHEHGFVHGDMKPDNVIVDEYGNAKIIDLGHACRIGTIKPRIQGSPDYIAPEQVRCQPLDLRTDIYNYGASLYWALTGVYMPSLLTNGKTGRVVERGPVPPPNERDPQIPSALSQMVMDCVQLRPADRPPSMAELIARWGRILQSDLAEFPS